jgi:hypothetical protein
MRLNLYIIMNIIVILIYCLDIMSLAFSVYDYEGKLVQRYQTHRRDRPPIFLINNSSKILVNILIELYLSMYTNFSLSKIRNWQTMEHLKLSGDDVYRMHAWKINSVPFSYQLAVDDADFTRLLAMIDISRTSKSRY